MLTEEIERLRDLAYETGWLAARAELDIKIDEGYQKRRIDERNDAAAAIAKRLSEGVAWSGEGKLWDRRNGWFQVVDDHAHHIGGFYDPERQDIEDGQLVEVTVKIVEGTKDAEED